MDYHLHNIGKILPVSKCQCVFLMLSGFNKRDVFLCFVVNADDLAQNYKCWNHSNSRQTIIYKLFISMAGRAVPSPVGEFCSD